MVWILKNNPTFIFSILSPALIGRNQTKSNSFLGLVKLLFNSPIEFIFGRVLKEKDQFLRFKLNEKIIKQEFNVVKKELIFSIRKIRDKILGLFSFYSSNHASLSDPGQKQKTLAFRLLNHLNAAKKYFKAKRGYCHGTAYRFQRLKKPTDYIASPYSPVILKLILSVFDKARPASSITPHQIGY